MKLSQHTTSNVIIEKEMRDMYVCMYVQYNVQSN